MKLKFIAPVMIVVVLVLSAVLAVLYVQNQSSGLIQACPDEWIEDRMPTIDDDGSPRDYFIIDGERKETKNYDVEWIQNNCMAEVQYAY